MASITPSRPQEALDRDDRLLDHLVIAAVVRDAARDAVTEMVLEQRHRDPVERSRDRRDLGHDVDAIRVVLHHPLDPPNLALDASEPDAELLLVFVVADHRLPPPSTIPLGGIS